MDNRHGFSLRWEQVVSELKSKVRLWEHIKSGAQVLSFCNDDENKVFGVSFRTPPKDSTGVAHILEHSVLCGSTKYPGKEPFVELLKGSLQTFLNAFTYPDKTCYPVASANEQDFYNLVDVYLDAVLHPFISLNTFAQEGWHVEAEDRDSPLIYKGVVYNEMKGVYSSPDSVLAESSQQSLFPDITYGLDSGGKPEKILELTYDQFREFHRLYYHPGNGRFFFWGDDAEEKRLELLGRVLADFSRMDVDSAVPAQEPLPGLRVMEVPYAADEDDEGLGMVTMNWLLPETVDPVLNFSLQMLDHILVGLPGSPLRRALIESELGEDLIGSGLENELRQMYYSIGMQGVNPENFPKVEALIMDTLKGLAETGFTDAEINAAENTVEFALRENNTGRFPVGLAIMLRSLSTWLYDASPLTLLRYEEALDIIKSRLARGENVFRDLIRKYFLDNEHRTIVRLTPDLNLAARKQKDEEDRLADYKASLSVGQIDEIIARTKQLHELQEKPDDPAHLAAIPQLKLADLPRENRNVHKTEGSIGDAPALFHYLPTAGIAYVKLAFDMAALPTRLVPLLPLFSRALLEMGTTRRSYVDLGLEVAAQTGGMGAYPTFMTSHAGRKPVSYFMVSGKSNLDRVGGLADLFREIILDTEFDNLDRFRQMLFEERARQEQHLVPAGHSVVISRLAAVRSVAGGLAELADGISNMDIVRDWADHLDERWPALLADLNTMRDLLLRRHNLIINVTQEERYTSQVQRSIESVVEALPDGELPEEKWTVDMPVMDEALLIPAGVNYIGKGANLYDLGYEYHGSINVILKHLRTAWLWDKVRVQGGAYGAFSSFDRISGAFSFVSYRDPNVERTLGVYDDTADYLRNLELTPMELERSIIGAIGDLDVYQLPSAKGSASFYRHLIGDTREIRQKMREEVLSTTVEDFRSLGEVMAKVAETGNVCLLGGAGVEEFAKEKNIFSRRA